MVSSVANVNNDLINIQNQTVAANAAANKTTVGSSTLDQNSFLQLLIAQMKNQDPSNPTDPTQMLTEQSQLTMVQAMESLKSSLTSSSQLQEASSLIGKSVTVTDPADSTKTISGNVSGATVNNGTSEITIGNNSYSLSSILSVQNASTTSSN